MKRITALILAILLFSTLLFSCNNDTTESTDEKSNFESTGSSNTESDTSNSHNDDGEIKEIDAIFKYDLPKNIEYVNIIDKNSYTLEREPAERFPDSGKALTSNTELKLGSTTGFVGFLGKKDIAIVVDLGENYSKLCGFSVSTYFDQSIGRGVPRCAEMFVSTDGEKYVRAASAMPYSAIFSAPCIYTFNGYTEKGFDARYVKIVLSQLITTSTLVGNVKVYKAVEKQIIPPEVHEDYYINEELPKDVKPTFWENSEKDFAERQNLIKGLKQRVYAISPLLKTLETDYYNTREFSNLLTNGKFGDSDYQNSEYFHITRGLGREILYDLKNISCLSSATFGFILSSGVGIAAPEDVNVRLSVDGKNWQSVAYKSLGDFGIVINDKRKEVTLDFGGEYKARFVKFTFKNSAHFWLDELEVFGTKKISDTAKDLVPKDDVDQSGAYPSLDVLDGSQNILLAYNYKPADPLAGLRTKEQYLPLVGYYNTDKELKDLFFDTFLYLPCHTTCPSGGELHSTAKVPAIASDWLDYEENLFKKGYNIDALNSAVEEVKTQLQKTDYKAKVYLPIFNSSDIQTNFGDIDGDGISEDMSKLENRKKVAKWWIDKNIKRLNDCGYKNLELKGFYWYDEALNLGNENELAMLEYTTSYIHSLGYFIIWIPFYQSGGFSSWKKVGFDMANMQPNYMFNPEYPESILYDNADLTKKLGMGVEIEIDGKVFTDPEYLKRYMAYLRVGAEKGYMNTIKMYYSDAVPGVYLDAYNSKDPVFHSIYDMTYLYAKGMLDIKGSKPKCTDYQVKKDEQFRGKFEFIDGSVTDIKVLISPIYGNFAANQNGDIRYVPRAGFKGQDRVLIEVSNGFSTTIITLKFNIE